jgi:alkylation response protein AidB-like acyl-CoA dehydrogenase
MLTAARVMQEAKSGGVSEVSSILKTVGTRLVQERAELMIELGGLQALGWEGDGFSAAELAGVRSWLGGKASTIYGGSTEIQYNVVAKRILGMLDHQ